MKHVYCAFLVLIFAAEASHVVEYGDECDRDVQCPEPLICLDSRSSSSFECRYKSGPGGVCVFDSDCTGNRECDVVDFTCTGPECTENRDCSGPRICLASAASSEKTCRSRSGKGEFCVDYSDCAGSLACDSQKCSNPTREGIPPWLDAVFISSSTALVSICMCLLFGKYRHEKATGRSLCLAGNGTSPVVKESTVDENSSSEGTTIPGSSLLGPGVENVSEV